MEQCNNEANKSGNFSSFEHQTIDTQLGQMEWKTQYAKMVGQRCWLIGRSAVLYIWCVHCAVCVIWSFWVQFVQSVQFLCTLCSSCWNFPAFCCRECFSLTEGSGLRCNCFFTALSAGCALIFIFFLPEQIFCLDQQNISRRYGEQIASSFGTVLSA